MERIHYAGSSVLTGDAIAQSLLHYAEALALRKGSSTVDIPVRRPSGEPGRASIVIGPASQLFSESEDSDGDELVDPALVEHLQQETAALGISHPVAEADDAAPVQPGPEIEIPEFDGDDRAW